MTELIGRAALEAIRVHAAACFPSEACGVILDDGGYRPLANVAADPEREFRFADDAYLALAPRIRAIVHTHPNGPGCPSKVDMEQQIATGVPWALLVATAAGVGAPVVWGLSERPPLLGRRFVHGVTDCYALVRDWHHENGIDLPEIPRDDGWWRDGGDLYRQGFGPAGFVEISPQDARTGDVALMRIRSDVPNHAGVIVDGDLMLHHLFGQLSQRTPFGRYRPFVTHALRHRGFAA